MERHEFGGDPGEGGVKTLLEVEAADAGFKGGGIAEGLEEAVGGHADGERVIDTGALGEDALAGEEGENGITDPGEFELFAGALLFCGHVIGVGQRRGPGRGGAADFRVGRGRRGCGAGFEKRG